MDLHDLTAVLTTPGPFVTVHVETESAVPQAAAKYDLTWKDVLRELEDKGVDEPTRTALYEARGEHAEGASRLVVATTSDATVRLAVPLGSTPRRPVIDVSPLPHLLPLVDDVTTRVPHVVILADHAGADVSAYYDSEHVAKQVTVKGQAPDIRKVPVGGWSQLRYQQRAENGWEANAREVVDAVVDLAQQVGAQLIVAAGEDRQLVLVEEHLPTHLKDSYVAVRGGRGQDGSEALVRRRVSDAVSLHVATGTLDLLEGYAQERGQHKRAVDGLADVVQALRKAQVQTLLVATDAPGYSTLLFGPEPTQLGTTAAELSALGVDDPQEGPMIDVLLRAALGTAADVQLVPHELPTAPRGGVGAVLRYADSITTPSDATEA